MTRHTRCCTVLASALALGLLPACLPPTPAPQPSAAPATSTAISLTTIPLEGLTFPAVSGATPGDSGADSSSSGAGTGGTATGSADALPGPPMSAGSGGSSGGSAGGALSFEGYLEHPTFAGHSAVFAYVATEAELRAALADGEVTNIELTADIDLTADAETLDLTIDRSISLSGFDHLLTADTVTILASASGSVIQAINFPNAVEADGLGFLRVMDCVLGSGNPSGVAFTATGGDDLTLSSCEVEGGSIGVVASGGATLNLAHCNVRSGLGAIANGATLNIRGGTFTNAALGINVINGVAAVDATTFAGTANTAISVTANAAGTALTVDEGWFTNGHRGIAIGGTTAATVAVRTSTFNNNDEAVDFNYAFTTWTATLTGNNFFSNDAADVGVSMAASSGVVGLVDTWRASNTFSVYDLGRDILIQP